MLAKLQGRGAASASQPPTFGCLIVGIGGNNGVTMLAGLRANQLVRDVTYPPYRPMYAWGRIESTWLVLHTQANGC
jgi:hypothetical protein